MVRSISLRSFPIFGQSEFGLEHGGVLLNLLDKPALILSLQQNKIEAVSTKATELTAYTHEELLKLKLIDLFPEIFREDKDLTTFFNNANTYEHETILVSRNHNRIPVVIVPHKLDDDGSWCLLTIQTISDRQQHIDVKTRQKDIITSVEKLASIFPHSNLQKALNEVLEVGNDLTGASVLAVYCGAENQPKLKQVAEWGNSNRLSADIPLNDLVQLYKPTVWISGRQTINTKLHQIAYANGLTYLASAPLGETGALIGLVAVGGGAAEPPNEILPLVKILSGIVSGFIQKDILITNLRREINAITQELTIGETIVESVQDGIIVLTPRLTISSMNPKAETTLGYATPEVNDQTIYNVLIGTDKLSTALQSALNGVATHNLGDLTLHRRDGSVFPATIQIFPIIKDDNVLGVLILIRDLSEHEQIRLQTQQLEQRAILGEVTAILAHEVRNPINNLSTGLQILEMKLPDDSSSQDQIARLQHDLNRINQLMDSVLAFSRSNKYELVPTDIRHLVKRQLDRWRPRMSRLEIEQRLQVDPTTPKVLGDPYALEQVFTNLISNAVQAMEDTGGTIGIKLAPYTSPGGRLGVQIDVSDTGPGIADDVLEHIFEPFFTTFREGTGLGLAIIKRIITAHKGSIQPNSFPGGTVFRIWLPAANAQHPNNI